jgi:hypothetical protein
MDQLNELLKVPLLAKTLTSISRRKIGKTDVFIGDLLHNIRALLGVTYFELSISLLELSLLYVSDSERAALRIQVDYEIARLITESNGNGKEALRHINKSLSKEPAFKKGVCLKAVIQFKLGDTKGSIATLIPHLDSSVTDCLKSICMQDLKDSETPYVKARPLLEAIIRKKTNHFIAEIALN